jgi:hypothetical protein
MKPGAVKSAISGFLKRVAVGCMFVIMASLLLTLGLFWLSSLSPDQRAMALGLGTVMGVIAGGFALLNAVQKEIESIKPPLVPAKPGPHAVKSADYLSVVTARLDRVNGAIDAIRQTALALVAAVAAVLAILGANGEVYRRLAETPVVLCGTITLAILAAILCWVIVAIPWHRFSCTPAEDCSIDELVTNLRNEERSAIAVYTETAIFLLLGVMAVAMAVIGTVLALVSAR